MKRMIALLALSSLTLVGSPAQAASTTTVVGTDANDDWGTNVDGELRGNGAGTGMELVSASIVANNDGIANFVIGINELPESGGFPEVVRYLWELNVDGTHYEIDGKFQNYSRGTCDPTAGTCPPVRDPGEAPFLVRGACVSATVFNSCRELALVHATFDTETDTITIPVPIAIFGEGCISFGPGQNTASFPGANVVAIPSAFASQANLPSDYMLFESEDPVEVC